MIGETEETFYSGLSVSMTLLSKESNDLKCRINDNGLIIFCHKASRTD